MTPDCLAVIPARGGSKGIPRKNLQPVGGRPLLAHAIVAALQAKRISRVVVTTDDEEIADIARRFGADVVRRPATLADDKASSEAAVLHCLGELERVELYRPELVMLIQCTSPLSTSEDFDGVISTLLENNGDSCFTAVPFHHFIWKRQADGSVEGINHPGARRQRRQDLVPQLLENGATYVMRTEAFVREEDRFCGTTLIHEVAADRNLEIDDPRDLLLAEVLLRKRTEESRAHVLPSKVGALVLDFDGVLTDNRVLVNQDGTEAVLCSRGDGMGLGLVSKAGVELLILSKERNPVVTARAKKLNIECLQAVDDKPTALRMWLREKGVELKDTIFVGNDVNDVECMALAGCAACPADAHHKAVAVADIVLDTPGGFGAVRELCDLVVSEIDKKSDS